MLMCLPHFSLCRLDTVEQAELQYKKQEKKEAPAGWDVFNPKTLYNAYLKRAEKVRWRRAEGGGGGRRLQAGMSSTLKPCTTLI